MTHISAGNRAAALSALLPVDLSDLMDLSDLKGTTIGQWSPHGPSP